MTGRPWIKPRLISLFLGYSMPLKEERADEAEINDLARKIAEANKQKVAQYQLLSQASLSGPVTFAR